MTEDIKRIIIAEADDIRSEEPFITYEKYPLTEDENSREYKLALIDARLSIKKWAVDPHFSNFRIFICTGILTDGSMGHPGDMKIIKEIPIEDEART